MDPEDTGVGLTWTARTVRPVIALYVSGVFCGFIAVAHFVFHSPDAVKALSLTAIGAVASLVPAIQNRFEYRLTEDGLSKRPFSGKRHREFEEVFLWDELSHLVPTGSGFKYVKKLDGTNPIARFFRLHISGDFSGEFRVERKDLEKIRALMDRRARPISGRPDSPGTKPGSRARR